VILASDDFSGPGSGTGWKAGNDWEGLGGGVVSTAGGTGKFRDFAAPIDGTNQVTYIRFNMTQSAGPLVSTDWGGGSLFEGIEGTPGSETHFAGRPGAFPRYGLDPFAGLNAAATVDSGIAIDNQTHSFITAIDTTPAGASTTYRIWIDSFNINAPTATKTVNSPIDAPWGTYRMQSAAALTILFDNLTIATTAGEVGLVPEPASLGLLGFFGVAMVVRNRRRR
jgi:hypothetical protein